LIVHPFSISKLDVVHDQLQLVEPLDPLPAFLGGLEQLEHHRQRGVPGAAGATPFGSQSHCREGGLNRVCCPKVNPVRGWKIVEGQQFVTILLKVFHRFRVLVPKSTQGAVKGLVSTVPCLCQVDLMQR